LDLYSHLLSTLFYNIVANSLKVRVSGFSGTPHLSHTNLDKSKMKKWFSFENATGGGPGGAGSANNTSGSATPGERSGAAAGDRWELEAGNGVLVSQIIAEMEKELDVSVDLLSERLEKQRMVDLMQETRLIARVNEIKGLMSMITTDFVGCICEDTLQDIPGVFARISNALARLLPDETLCQLNELLDMLMELIHRVENVDIYYLKDEQLVKFVKIAVGVPCLSHGDGTGVDGGKLFTTQQFIQQQLLRLLNDSSTLRPKFAAVMWHVLELEAQSAKLQQSGSNSKSSSSSCATKTDSYLPVIEELKNVVKRKLRVFGVDNGNVTNPRFNRAYGETMETLRGYRNSSFNPIPYGPSPEKMVYYHCPYGWRRISLSVDGDFDSQYGTWHVGYAGLKHPCVLGLLAEGLMTQDYDTILSVLDTNLKSLFVFTPSIVYAQHPQFATVYQVNDKFCQCLLMCRINNAAIVGNTGQVGKLAGFNLCDPNFANENLEFVVDDGNHKSNRGQRFVIYAVILRVLAMHPRYLVENAWISNETWK
jgi:hypothetical protein